MMLLTKPNKTKLIANYNTNQKTIIVDGSVTDFKPVVKLFNPTGVGTWLLTELDPETNVAFGLCDLNYPELGYVSIDEMSATRLPFDLKIERDRNFKANKTLSEYADLANDEGVIQA